MNIKNTPTGYTLQEFICWTNADHAPGGLVSPEAKIHPSVKILCDSIVKECTIEENVVVGDKVHVLSSTTLERNVHLIVNSQIGANVLIQQDSRIGANSILCNNVHIGKYCNIGDNVIVGDNAKIHEFSSVEDNVFILPDVTIGYGCSIHENSTIYGKVENNCVIGRDNFIGKGAVISAYCHLGKNVEIGDNVLLPTRTLLADNVILSQGEMWETFLTKEGVITSVCKDNCWLFWGAGKTGVTAKEFLEDDHIFLVQTWVKSFLTQGE